MQLTRRLCCVSSFLVGASLILPGTVQAQERNLEDIERRLVQLEEQVAEYEAKEEESEDGITLGGAVRFQYVLADYDNAQKKRGGDIDFDIFRLDLDGKVGDVILSAQYRWFHYMESLRHAYIGYDFTDEWQGQIGIVVQPFGVMPYNSHNYFFNSTFYMGLEDNIGAGVKFTKRTDVWDFDIAFITSDEKGGATGFTGNYLDYTQYQGNRYNYAVGGIRLPGEGAFDEITQQASENNTLMLRAARKWQLGDDQQLELGASTQIGRYDDGTGSSIGDRRVYGFHGVYDIGQWQFHGQYALFDNDLDIANEGLVVGAYGFVDTIPETADIITGNVAYTLPVDIGPITSLQFYSNNSVITNKSGLEDDTVMNILGMAVSAGGMFTYVDIARGQNQPFVNGSIGQDGGSTNTRFNINFGFYF